MSPHDQASVFPRFNALLRHSRRFGAAARFESAVVTGRYEVDLRILTTHCELRKTRQGFQVLE